MKTSTAPRRKISKEKVQPTYVHIHAKCAYFEIHEQVLESKSEARLKDIRDGFNRHKHYEDKLVVKTGVINPKMF